MVSRRCPYGSDLSESENQCPYQNDQNRWEMNELKWIEWNEVKWVIWRNWLCEPYGKVPMVRRGWTLSKWLDVSDLTKPYQNEWNRWEMNEMKWIERFEVIWVNWRKWARTTLWESPYGQKKVSLWEWLDVSENESPYQNDQNRWDLNE